MENWLLQQIEIELENFILNILKHYLASFMRHSLCCYLNNTMKYFTFGA